MNMPPIVADVDREGKVPDLVKRRIGTILRGFCGETVEFRICKHRDKRSSKQNARLWALYTVAAKSLGFDAPDEVHEACAWKLLRLPDDERTGTPRRKRTPKLSTSEFTEYMEAVERLLLEYGADLTDWDDETQRLSMAA